MDRRFRLNVPVRIAAGVIAVVGVPFVISTLRDDHGIDWKRAISFAALGLLFLYGALRGESPAWLEPSSWRHDPSAGDDGTSRPNDR